MDALFEKAASLLGDTVSADQLKLVASILFTYPCAVLYTYLPPGRPNVKHLLSITFILFIMLEVLHLYFGMVHIGATCLATFFLMKYYRGQAGPWLNFGLVMASMAFCHIDRQLKGYVGDSQLDYSGALMVLTIKLSSFGFNVLDGRTEDRYLTEYNQRMKIARYPTLIEFFGWAFFFGGFLTGPVCEYMDYIRFTNLPLVETAPNESKKPVSSNLSTWKPAMFVLTKSIILVIILVLFAPTYNYYAALEPAYLAMPFYQRFFFLQACGFMTRVKYYSVWVMAEGACVLCGLGFSGINSEGKPQWDRLRNVRIRECETAPSVKYYTENWNMKANIWLRHYVYLRLTPPGAKPAIKNTFCVYAISAMWHGFHPGYYLFFIPVGVYQTLSRSCRRLIRPLTLEPDQKTPRPFWKSAYDVVGWFFTYTVINFLIGAFDLLYISRILHIWRGIYYYHLWGAALLWGFYKLSYPFFMKLQKQRLQASEKAEDKKLSDLEVKTSQTMRKRTLKAE